MASSLPKVGGKSQDKNLKNQIGPREFGQLYSKWIWKLNLGKLGHRRNPKPALVQKEQWLANNFKGAGGGIGGAVRDNKGLLVSMFSVNVEREEILALEILAGHRGLKLASTLGLTSIWMEVDSKLAADVINGNTKIPWRCFHRMQEIHHLLSLFQQWRITHIWREGNSVADFLSKRKCPCKGTDIPPFLSPLALLQLLDTDRRGTDYCRM
ncbi:uncharacterized protein LOC143855999 [Tasmannia lanceolata]|uniref:uncharacterized protein LOC143855999 n=1 Tax=Tasmannia lanceolata TaxID=3420 RepID=UPI00406437F1